MVSELYDVYAWNTRFSAMFLSCVLSFISFQTVAAQATAQRRREGRKTARQEGGKARGQRRKG